MNSPGGLHVNCPPARPLSGVCIIRLTLGVVNFMLENIKSFVNMEMTQFFEILPYRRQEPVYIYVCIFNNMVVDKLVT